jgi:hypothetical protein
MLVAQYSPNWKQFFIMCSFGTGFISFVFEPILSAFDIFQLMRWNYIYEFMAFYAKATLARVAFHLLIQIQEKAREGKTSPLQNMLIQPAFKPLDDNDEKDK